MPRRKYKLETEDFNLILMLISEKTQVDEKWARDEDDPIHQSICNIIDCFEYENKKLLNDSDPGTAQWIEDIDERLNL